MLTTAAVLLGACDASAGEAPPRPTGKPSVTTCVNSSGALIADIDGDTLADRVLDPSRVGAELTIEFGKEGGYEKPVGPRKLVGGSDGGEEDVLAAVADYNRDGWSDLVIVATGKWHGDDPIDPSVAELRLGPFSATGQGQRTRALDLGEIRGLAVADYDHDPYPDLAAFTYAGDGVYQTEARLGNGTSGLADATDDTRVGYTVVADRTDDDTPTNMPRAGLKTFYPQCGKG
ncbi:VCBS repeat-containing protein [Streptomyces sp. NPDC088341]|uniref:VCBS repeat-containing protein n=1 Tax=Streptomyces sp. NPDC088341 TaxID=3154870 RepID=UPI0034252935